MGGVKVEGVKRFSRLHSNSSDCGSMPTQGSVSRCWGVCGGVANGVWPRISSVELSPLFLRSRLFGTFEFVKVDGRPSEHK